MTGDLFIGSIVQAYKLDFGPSVLKNDVLFGSPMIQPIDAMGVCPNGSGTTSAAVHFAR